MKVVVTGGSGKLGQWVVRELLDDSNGKTPHEVTVFGRSLGAQQENVRYVVGDHQDLGHVVGALAGADAVLHLSAVPRPGIVTNEVTFRSNVMGMFNIHEAAWRLGIRRVVTSGSEAVLGWTYHERGFLPDYLPIDEDHPVRPQDAYGLSKEACEAIARSYAEKCDMETVVLRATWIISPEELDQLQQQGGRKPSRFAPYNYIDVRDVARACRLAIERPIKGNVALYIVADDSSVAEPLCELFPRLEPRIGDKAHDLTGSRPSVSNARAKAVLGWQPLHSWRHSSKAPKG